MLLFIDFRKIDKNTELQVALKISYLRVDLSHDTISNA